MLTRADAASACWFSIARRASKQVAVARRLQVGVICDVVLVAAVILLVLFCRLGSLQSMSSCLRLNSMLWLQVVLVVELDGQ